MWDYRTELVRVRRTVPAELQALQTLLAAAGRDGWKLEFTVSFGNDWFLLIFLRPCRGC